MEPKTNGEDLLLEKIQGMIEDKTREMGAELAKASAQRDALRQQLNAMSSEGSARAKASKTIGAVVVESDQFKRRNSKGMAEVELGSKLGDVMLRGNRAVTTTLSPLSQTAYDEDIAYLDRFRQPSVAELISWIPVSTSSIEYTERDVFYELYADIASQAASGQADIVLTNAQGVVKGSTLTIDPSGAGNGPETGVVSSVNLTTNTVTLTANLSNTHNAGMKVVADEVAPTAEGSEAPQYYEYWSKQTATVKSIRSYLKVSNDALDDSARLQAELDMDLGDMLRRTVSRHILYGTGTNQELTGILAASGISTVTWSAQASGTTRRDLLRIAIKTLAQSDRAPEAFLLHPDECSALDLEKDSQNRYIMPIQIMAEGRVKMEWRVPVFETTEINSGTGLLANFTNGVRGYDRQQDSIDMSTSDQDDFVKDLVTFRGKRRLALAVKEPKAIVKITFDSAP